MRKRKKFLILIYPGPSYAAKETFDERLCELSKNYQGVLITTAPRASKFRLHDFELICVSLEFGKIVTMLRLLTTMHKVLRCRPRKSGVDLIVTYDPLRSGLLGLLAKWRSHAKFAPEVNGDYDDIANYEDVAIVGLRRAKRSLYVAVERFVLGRADGIKLLYPEQISRLKVNIDNKKVVVFSNRVPVERFHISEMGEYVLTVGFPWQVKGIDITIRAFHQIRSEFPNWKLKVIGWYPDSRPLERLIGSTQQIELIKPVPYRDMAGIIGKCGIFVLASRTESMGRALVEAMAAGKPRIATNVGGIPTVVADGIDGLLVPPEAVGELASAMRLLMGDESLRVKLGRAGKKRAATEFSKDAYYTKLHEFYDQLLLV